MFVVFLPWPWCSQKCVTLAMVQQKYVTLAMVLSTSGRGGLQPNRGAFTMTVVTEDGAVKRPRL